MAAPPEPPPPAPEPMGAAPTPTPPPPPTDMPAPPPEEEKPKVNVGVWLRAGVRFQKPADPTKPGEPEKLGDTQMDTLYGELHLSGQVHENVTWTFNLNANGLAGTAGIEDAIAEFNFVDPFHLWVGQLLVPSDRSNFSGPFFMSPWNYPGVYSVPGATGGGFIGPSEGPAGRNAGAVAWGDFGEGLFKYYAGVFQLNDPTISPLYTGRLNISPIGKEPGFYNSSTYYGSKDIVALGVGVQSQKNGSVDPAGALPPDDFFEFNADLLAEFGLGGSGVITGEGAFYHFNGDFNPADNAFFVLASYLTPKVGPGALQPLVRYQWAKKNGVAGADDLTMSVIDAALSYVIEESSLRVIANYQYTNLGTDPADPDGDDVVGNAIQLGAQLMQ